MKNSLLHLLPIFSVGAISFAIIVERMMALFLRYPLNVQKFISEVKQRILANDIAGAIQICSDQGAALAAKVAKAGLLRASRDNQQIGAALEIETHEAIGLLRKRVAYLAMFANVATLFGLLGTVLGLIKSFAAVASVDAATKSLLLAEGISVSMNATASGLVVAIPTMIAFSVLQSKANRLVEQVEMVAMSTYDLLSGRSYREEWEEETAKPSLTVIGGGSTAAVSGSATKTKGKAS